jgi:hypothetical protein
MTRTDSLLDLIRKTVKKSGYGEHVDRLDEDELADLCMHVDALDDLLTSAAQNDEDMLPAA